MSLQDAALTIEFYVEAQLRLSMWNRLRKIIAEKMDRFCSWRAKVCLNKFYMNDIEAMYLVHCSNVWSRRGIEWRKWGRLFPYEKGY